VNESNRIQRENPSNDSTNYIMLHHCHCMKDRTGLLFANGRDVGFKHFTEDLLSAIVDKNKVHLVIEASCMRQLEGSKSEAEREAELQHKIR